MGLVQETGQLLSRLPTHLATDLFASATRVKLAADQVLFLADDPGDSCYRVDDGLLKVKMVSRAGTERILSFISRGGIVGELAILDGLPRSASVVAVRDTVLSRLSRAEFDAFAEKHPELPAWQELGAQAWAQYSRLADLGTGLVAYPIEGIGSTLLTLATTVSHYVEKRRAHSAMMALYCASALSVAALLLTTRAAPVMLSLASLQTEAAIRHAFDQFFLWGLYLRGTADVLAFIALIWAYIGLKGVVCRRLTPKQATHGET